MIKLFYENQYIKNFDAKIIDILKKDNLYHIVLDKTAFFPGGGGQRSDRGVISNKDVVDVYEIDKKIYHVLENCNFNVGENVSCSIDWDIRQSSMQKHLAQHILSGCFYKLFNLNTTSVHFGENISTVDINGNLCEEMIREAESLANDMIHKNLSVEALIPTKNELKNILTRRKLPDTNEPIRILKIGDLDINACCGVHPNNTLELRAIKLLKYEKNKQSTRIQFITGKEAINYFLKRDDVLIKLCKQFSATDETILNNINALNNKLDEEKLKNNKLEEKLLNLEIKNLKKINLGEISVFKKIYSNEDTKFILKIANNLTKSKNNIVLFSVDEKIIFACSKNLDLDMSKILKEVKGGGNKNLFQGVVDNKEKIEYLIDLSFNKVKKYLQKSAEN